MTNTRQLAVSSDGALLAAAGDDGVVSVWDVASRTVRARHPDHSDVYRLAFVPGRPWLASASWDGVWVWNALTGHDVAFPVDEPVHGLACSHDGRWLAVGTSDGPVLLTELEEGFEDSEPRRLTGHTDAVFGVAFLPDGRRLATMALDGSARLWDISDGSVLRESRESRSLYWMALSPTGNHLAYVTESTVRLRHLPDDTLVHVADAPGWTRVTFTADGELLVVAGATMSVHSAWSGTAHGTVADFPGQVESMAAVPGSNLVATGHPADAVVRLWDAGSRFPAGQLV